MSVDEDRDNRVAVAIIREVYDSDLSHEIFEQELEKALEAAVSTIIIEPTTLGDETARWIAVGNCLHKTAVLAGFGSLMAGLIWTDSLYIYIPLSSLSLFCSCIYTVSWQFDPCCKYQVEYDSSKLSKLPIKSLSSTTPVVLMRKDDSKRKILHTTVSIMAFSYSMWRLYQAYQ